MKYQHSILTVSDLLHGAVSGSGDPMPAYLINPLVSWLAWRVEEGWAPSFKEFEPYENAVRELGRLAVAEARAYLEDV